MNHLDNLVINTLSTKEKFDALMAEAEAEALIAKFGSDEQLEARISRDNYNYGGSYC